MQTQYRGSDTKDQWIMYKRIDLVHDTLNKLVDELIEADDYHHDVWTSIGMLTTTLNGLTKRVSELTYESQESKPISKQIVIQILASVKGSIALLRRIYLK